MQYIGNISVLFSRISSFMLELLILIALACLAIILLNVLFRISRNRKFDRFSKISVILLPIVMIIIYFQYFHFYDFEEPDINQLTYKVEIYNYERDSIELNKKQKEVVDRIIQNGHYKSSFEPLYSYQTLKNQIELSIYNPENPRDILYIIFNGEEMNVVFSPELKNQLIVEINVEELYNYLILEFD